MAGPCLPNLCSLRLVNFSLGSLKYTAQAQTFFSLHYGSSGIIQSTKHNGHATKKPAFSEIDLLYVSETLPVVSKLNFGTVSLPTLPNHSYLLRVKLWVLTGVSNSKFQLFYEILLDVRNLKLTSKTIYEEEGDAAFCENSFIWNFDGLEYCLQSHVQPAFISSIITSVPAPKLRSKLHKVSYTVDDVRHMSSLIVGLRDFEQLKEKTSTEIDALLDLHSSALAVSESDKVERFKVSNNHLDKLISRQFDANQVLGAQITSIQNVIDGISQSMDKFPSYESLIQEEQEIASSQVRPLRDALAKSVYPDILTATQYVVSVLSETFPIELSESSGLYRISGIEFPASIKEILNVCYNDSKKLTIYGLESMSTEQEDTHHSSVDCVNAGLAEIVRALNFLSLITEIPLKYEMTFKGSHSFLVEHLSPQQVVSNNQKTPAAMHVSTKVKYPLYYNMEEAKKHQVQPVEGQKHPRNIRFERALALLHRNLTFFVTDVGNAFAEYNREKEGVNRRSPPSIPMDCSDHFLWILHYLMLFMTAPG